MSITKFQRMARSLPGFYNAEVNIMIGGLLQGWGISDDEIQVQIQETKKQLFVNTAEGKYLDLLGSNVGVPRDPGLGIEDSDFRKLIPVMSYYPKQVRQTIIALLDVFWGPGFSRPNVNSGNVETFNFGPSSVLNGTLSFYKDSSIVKGTGTLFLTELNPGDFIKPNTITSDKKYLKVSQILSDTELVLSDVWIDNPQYNVLAVKGVIRELQYKVDRNDDVYTIRFFPNNFEDINNIPVSELVNYINSDVIHRNNITASLFLDPQLGNKLNIRTNSTGLLSSIQIVGGDANDLLRLNFDLEEQRETKVNVFEINPNEIVVKIPSSVPVLRRSLKGSAHPRQTKTTIYSEAEIFDFDSLGLSSTLDGEVDGNIFSITFTHASDFEDPEKVTAQELATVLNTKLSSLYFTADNRRVAIQTTDGSAEYQITGGTANAILNFDITLQQDPDLIESEFPSSYLFDPVGQLFTVTGIKSILDENVGIGENRSTILLDDTSDFPNTPGKILLNFGRSNQEGPVNYISRPNNSTLLIDASYTFQNEHLTGRNVNYISNAATLPRVTGDDYAVYVTGTEEARLAAQTLIRKLLAAGVIIRFVIEFPEYLFECLCRECGAPTTVDYRGSLTGSGFLNF